jgi:hypothetical protein
MCQINDQSYYTCVEATSRANATLSFPYIPKTLIDELVGGNRMNTKKSLYTLMAMMFVFVITIFTFALYFAEIGFSTVNEVYNDHLVPILQIKTISDNYRQSLITTVRKTGDNLITWEESRKRTAELTKEINNQWKAFLGTKLDPAEKALIAEITPLMEHADADLSELRDILVRENPAELKQFRSTKIYQNVDPLLTKLSKLATLEQIIADQKHKEYEVAYRKGRIHAIIVMTVSLLLIGTIVGAIIKRLLQNLGADPSELRKIAETVASGDLSINVHVNDDNQSGVLWSLKIMVDNLREMMSKLETKKII